MTAPIAFQTRRQRWLELARDVSAAACLRGDFVLSSSGPSVEYIDKYLFETRPTILRRLAALMAESVDSTVDRLAGRELGAVPLVTALSLETGLPFVIVRSGRNPHVVGELHSGERVLLIEDVIMTGAQAITTLDTLTARGADTTGVLAAIDRGDGGGQNLSAAGHHVEALFTYADLQKGTDHDNNR